jgi:hypothetical protein
MSFCLSFSKWRNVLPFLFSFLGPLILCGYHLPRACIKVIGALGDLAKMRARFSEPIALTSTVIILQQPVG